MSDNKDRKLWKAKDVIFYTPQSPVSDNELKEAEEFFDKFKPDNDEETSISNKKSQQKKPITAQR